jgi:DNA-binding transcriptional LysR family regulator
MNRFLATLVFTRVAESGGFTAASRKLGMSVSSITKSVARLEDELGVQLLNRTTRRMALTDYGQEFYERSVRILAELEDAETAMRQANLSPRGRVRVVMPFSFGRVTVVPALGAFYARYPDITLDLNFSDVAVDLIEAGYDVAVRTAEVRDADANPWPADNGRFTKVLGRTRRARASGRSSEAQLYCEPLRPGMVVPDQTGSRTQGSRGREFGNMEWRRCARSRRRGARHCQRHLVAVAQGP